MSLFTNVADHRRPTSLAARLRARRLAFFRDLLERVPRPATILDVGGTSDFWKRCGLADEGIKVVLLNSQRDMIDDPQFESIIGDARDLSAFGNAALDVVYSNSVIEHVGTFDDQRRMANEVRRVAKRYFVQTPNAWFPIEPHFLVPGFQFMPIEMRAFLLRQSRLGWVPRERDRLRAKEIVGSVQLLTGGEVAKLFPEAMLYREHFLGMTKSIVAYHGW
jgi:Methyltransferase domain